MTLTDDVASVLAGRAGSFGIYARNLATGAVVDIDADRVMPAESAVKTAVLLHYEREVVAGRVDPARRVTLGPRARPDGSGVLRYLADGLAPTLEDLAWLMIIVSDNVATELLVDELGGPDRVNATARTLGSPTTRWLGSFSLAAAVDGHLVSESSPRDLAELYAHLGDRSRRILFRQQFQAGLPLRVPHNAFAADIDVDMPVRVYNKTGLGIGRFIDSGLFETTTGDAWVIAAMADEQADRHDRPEAGALAAFGHVGELLYEAWGCPADG